MSKSINQWVYPKLTEKKIQISKYKHSPYHSGKDTYDFYYVFVQNQDTTITKKYQNSDLFVDDKYNNVLLTSGLISYYKTRENGTDYRTHKLNVYKIDLLFTRTFV